MPIHVASGTVIGTLGSPWRATVTSWGALAPSDGSPPLDWWVAADDRWHTPATEPSRRQHRVQGTPVVETVIGVPGGDIVHRAYAVADGGGAPIVEVENRSSLPVAVAFSRSDALTGRPLAPLPPDAPVGAAIAVPIGHRSTVRVGLARAPSATTPSAEQVARGWVTQTEAATRFVVPDDGLASRVVAARADALLADVSAFRSGGDGDIIELVLTVAERCRLGDDADAWVPEVARAAVAIAKGARHGATWDAVAALDAVVGVLSSAGESTAAADVAAMAARLGPAIEPDEPPDGVRVLAWLEGRLLRRSVGGVELLTTFPPSWAGQGIEVYDGRAADLTVAFAVRWHGERPALLWELSAPARLTCPGLDPSWSAASAMGEALLAPYRA
jgi:hypothetical protein